MLDAFLSNYALAAIFLIPGIIGLLGVAFRPEAWSTSQGRNMALALSIAFTLLGLTLAVGPLFPVGE